MREAAHSEMDTCVFCARCYQPQTLFQTPSLCAMPDKYPTVPGHILIISRDPLPCYAAASADALRELERATARPWIP